jgi:hypothetical protein
MIKPSDDCVFGIVVIGGAIILALLAALVFAAFAGASGAAVVLTPGRITAASCAESAMMPIINWTAKGWLQVVTLHQDGNCRLLGEWNASKSGYYCTGIGTLDGADWVPDECVTVAAERVRKVNKFRNIWKCRYQP